MLRQRLEAHKLRPRLSLRAAVVLAGVSAAVVPAAVMASGSTVSITLQTGSLLFSPTPSASDFPSTRLTGSQQTVHATFATWGVTDSSGSNAGWHVTFQATQLTGTSTAHPTLPTGSLALTGPTVSASGVNVAVPPVVQCVSCTLDSGPAVAITHALAATGQGAWTMTQANANGGDLALTIPANASADTYTSTLTFTLATGP